MNAKSMATVVMCNSLSEQAGVLGSLLENLKLSRQQFFLFFFFFVKGNLKSGADFVALHGHDNGSKVLCESEQSAQRVLSHCTCTVMGRFHSHFFHVICDSMFLLDSSASAVLSLFHKVQRI